MSKKNYLYLIGLILLFLLAGLAFLITNEVSLNAATTPKLGPPITPNLTPKGPGTPYTPIVGTPIASGANGNNGSRSFGLPAIQPRTTTSSASTPAFTEQDVRDYLKAHPGAPRIHASTTPVVATVEFITNKEVKARLNAMTDVSIPDSAVLCYVELSGDFEFPAAPGAAPVKGNRIYELFDAQTGNFFMSGPAPLKK